MQPNDRALSGGPHAALAHDSPVVGPSAPSAPLNVGTCRLLDANLPALGIQYHRLDSRNALDHGDEVEPPAKVFSHCPGIAGSLHALDTGEAWVQRCLFARPRIGAASPLD